MRRILKTAAAFVLIPFVRWYLRKERSWTYEGITVKISRGVFHPGLFHSTKFLLKYLATLNLKDRTFLELGCGSGLISVYAAKKGAIVGASDLNPLAVANAEENARANEASIHCMHSDLFDNVFGLFDFIIINPPYYPRKARTDAELAWYCGEGFEYFIKLFDQLASHIGPQSQVIMVLTKGCDIDAITAISETRGYKLELLRERDAIFDEKDYLFRINSFS